MGQSATPSNQNSTADDVGSDAREAMERDLLRKLPDEAQPAEEWGERLATAQAIASGGASGGKIANPTTTDSDNR